MTANYRVLLAYLSNNSFSLQSNAVTVIDVSTLASMNQILEEPGFVESTEMKIVEDMLIALFTHSF